MLRALKHQSGIFRNQVLYVFIGTSIGYAAGVLNYFPWYRLPIPPFLNPLVSVSDSLTIVDSFVGQESGSGAFGLDGISIAELVSGIISAILPFNSESVITSEIGQVDIQTRIVSSESVVSTESVSGLIGSILLSVSEQIRGSEVVGFGGILDSASVSDHTSIGETVSVALRIGISVSDNVSETSVPTPERIFGVKVTDSYDFLTVTEVVAGVITGLTVGVSDSIGIQESFSVVSGIVKNINNTEQETVTEQVSLSLSTVGVAKSDTLSLSESVHLTIEEKSLSIPVTQSVSVYEIVSSATASVPDLNVAVLSQVLVTEALTIGLSFNRFLIASSDVVTLVESFETNLCLAIFVKDKIRSREYVEAKRRHTKKVCATFTGKSSRMLFVGRPVSVLSVGKKPELEFE